MFSDDDCRHLCARLGLSDEAVALIAQIRAAPPTRRVRSGAGNVCVRYPSRKMGVVIQAESHRVELAAIYAMEHDPNTFAFYDQPPSIPLVYRAKSGRSVTVRHTPDFFVIQADGIGWDEWKPESALVRLTHLMPARYLQDGPGNWRCPPGEQYAAAFGLRYRVRSAAEIDWIAQRNFIFLEDYLRAQTPPLDAPLLERIQTTVTTTPGISLADLLHTLADVPPDAVFTAIAWGHLYVDVSASLLVDPARVRVFADQVMAQAAIHLGAAHLQSGDEATAPQLHAGQGVLWEGAPWTVANVGLTTIALLSSTNILLTLPYDTVVGLVQQGTLTPTIPPAATGLSAEARALLACALPQDWAVANWRYAIIAPVLSGGQPPAPAPPARTIREWVARYRHAARELGCGYVGLLPRRWQRGNRTPRLSDQTRAVMDDVITSHYETLKHRSMRAAYGACVRQCEAQQTPAPSYQAFTRAAKRRPPEVQVARRQGPRAAYAHQPFHWTVGWQTPPHGDRPFEIGHIDHTELDVELVCSQTGRHLGRPWATFLMDAYSRLLLAWVLTFDPPSYRSCLLVLRACVRRHERLPQIIVVDGGNEFASVYFETLLARYGCTKKTRPSAEPRFGSVIERLFNTTNTAFVHTLQGNTQLTQTVRLVTAAVDPKAHACWTLDRLGQQLDAWASEVYATTDHPSLGQSPAAAFAQGLQQHGARAHRRIAYDQDFYLSTLPTTHRGTALVQPNRGVKIHYLTYWADAFRDPAVQRTQVPVRYDPFDAGTAYAFVSGRWVRCISEHYHRFRGRSEREITLASAELRARHQQHMRTFTITAARLADFLAAVEAEEVVLSQRLRDAQMRTAGAALLTPPDGDRPPLQPSVVVPVAPSPALDESTAVTAPACPPVDADAIYEDY